MSLHLLTDLAVMVFQQAQAQADSGPIDNLGTLIPIGGLTGGLITLFVMFLRDSARNDDRADSTAAKLVAGAEKERDLARQDLHDERQRALEKSMQEMEARKVLYERIRHLESLLWKSGIDPNTHPDDGDPT